MTTKPTSVINLMIEPARRHRCEICFEIFICHLCTIQHEHPLHTRIERIHDPTMCVFVCEDCVVSDNWRRIKCDAKSTALYTWYWDYLTGRRFKDLNDRDDEGVPRSRANMELRRAAEANCADRHS